MVMTRRGFVVALVLLCCASAAPAQDRFIVVASTTSTEQSGLFGYLLPLFEKKTGIQVRVVALGTGQALDLARRGDADVAFVHARAAEDKFVAEGEGVERLPVMYNDFVLIGPKSDPAKVAGGKDIVAALKKIEAAQAPFVSRGDRSGTHMAELDLWKASGIDLGQGEGPLVSRYRPRHGTGAQYRRVDERLPSRRPRHLARVQESRRSRDPRRRRQATVQPVRRHPREPGQASEREEGSRTGVHRLARLAGRPERRSPATRSVASSSSFRTRRSQGRELVDARSASANHGSSQ